MYLFNVKAVLKFRVTYKLFFRHLALPNLPMGLQIMADRGFQNRPPLLVPVGNQGQGLQGPIEL